MNASTVIHNLDTFNSKSLSKKTASDKNAKRFEENLVVEEYEGECEECERETKEKVCPICTS